ncbi:hypothetical protein [Methylobacterium oryzisoli]|uniref:hypothetical protein n=1 Tax=Methylobacterium oryzisoli TaxID=3385502 RepID=UPI00389197E1
MSEHDDFGIVLLSTLDDHEAAIFVDLGWLSQMDTADIADALGREEHWVANCLAKIRDAQRPQVAA